MNIRKRSQDAGNIEVPHSLARYAAIRSNLPVTGCRVNVPISSTKQKKMAPATRHKIQGGAASAGWRFSVGIAPAILAIALAAAFIVAPALAKPRPSKSLTVERIYGGPSLGGYLARGIEWSPDAKRI